MMTSAEDITVETHDTTELVIDQEPEPAVHLARCGSCDVAVKFKPTSSGNAFSVIEVFGTSERTFGIGESGFPICPDGHGEMQLADEQLPAAEAFALAQEQLEATAPKAARLPFPSPPFNYEGALHEIFGKQSEVTVFEIKFNDADDRRKKAKAALDEAREELSKMIDIIREREEERLHEIARREADAEAGHVDGTNLVRCTWEQQHPGETCPICSSDLASATATDSVLHIDEVAELLDLRSAVAVSDALDAIDIVVPVETIRFWEPEQRAEVKAWAEFDRSSTEAVPPRPAILGTGHVAGEGVEGEPQCCTQCDAVLTAARMDGDDPSNFYDTGVLVGVDCPGRAKAEGQHYIGGKRKGRKKKTAAAAE